MLRSCALFLLLAGSPLALPLCVDLRREGVLELQRHGVDSPDPDREQNAGGLCKQQGRAEEAHRRANIHGRTNDIEGKAGDHVIQQDPEVIAQEGSRDAELPRRRDDKGVTQGYERVGGGLGVGREEERVRRLFGDGGLVDVVADDAEGEDCGCEGVAGCHGAAAEELGEDFVVVFLAMSGKSAWRR